MLIPPSQLSIYLVGISKEHQSDVLSSINLPLGKLPFRYLGVPLNSKSISSFDCEKLVDKMTNKIRGWKGKNLSYAARLQLVNFVLISVTTYCARLFLF